MSEGNRTITRTFSVVFCAFCIEWETTETVLLATGSHGYYDLHLHLLIRCYQSRATLMVGRRWAQRRALVQSVH